MMKKNEILVTYGTDYVNMTEELLREAGLAELIGDRNRRIGIKPNLVAPVLAAEGGTTHPEVVEGLIRYLQANGFQDLTIMEGSWVGDKTEESFEVCGYNELAEKYQEQLRYYAKALEQMSGKKVKEKIIYSFTLKKEVYIE